MQLPTTWPYQAQNNRLLSQDYTPVITRYNNGWQQNRQHKKGGESERFINNEDMNTNSQRVRNMKQLLPENYWQYQ